MSSSVWNQKAITAGKSSISQIILSIRNVQASCPSFVKQKTVCNTTFPTTENIAEMHFECACCKYILSYISILVPIACSFSCWWEAGDVCTINSSKSILEKWEKLGVVLDML